MASSGSDPEDIDCTDTEVFDGHLSPTTSSGTTHFYDDKFETQVVNLAGESQAVDPIDDEFETQIANPAGETQAFDIAGETQILSLCGETQLLDDDPIPTCIENMDFNTQILNDFDDDVGTDCYDDEGTDTTEINSDEDLSGDESAQSFDQLVDWEKGLLTSLPERDGRKDYEELPDKSTDKKCNSGPTRLVSIRAASLRASGLAAARSSASQTRNPWPSSVISDKDIEKSSLKDNHVDRQINLGQCCANAGELGNIKCRVGSSAVRKLFTEDSTPANDLGDLHELTAYDGDQLAGLSYVDSQEPGDLTQDNALDFVEKFLKDNSMEFDRGGTCKLDAMVQSKSIPNPKGQYDLANIVNCIRRVGESKVFDWDDNREDETGGDLFCRRKEEFFTEPRKLKGRRPDSNGAKEGSSLSIENTKSRFFCSESRLELGKGKENNESTRETTIKCKKNLRKKLDQQNDGVPCKGQLEDDVIEPDEQEVLNVGFDTQMAAEAMEALFHDGNIDKLVNNGENKRLENSRKDSFGGSPAGKPDYSLNLRQSAKRGRAKKRNTVNTERNRQRVLSQRSSGNLIKSCENETVKMPGKGKRTNADKISENENSGCVSNNGCRTVQKWPLCEKVVEVSPVAHRTRRSRIANQSKNAKAKRTKATEAVSKTLNMKTKKGTKNDAINSAGERSSCGMLAGEVGLSDKFLGQTVNRRKRSRNTQKTRSSLRLLSPLSLNENLEGPTVDRTDAENAHVLSLTVDMNVNKKNDGRTVSSVVRTTLEESPSKRRKPSILVCTTPPDNCRTPVNAASPVCMGNEYYKQSCKKSPSKSCLLKEIRDLTATGLVSGSLSTESRKRKDMNEVRVLYSQHLDEDIIKQQKKTLARLGVTVAPSMTEATHFIADKFVRTRNMLEAIAHGKLVVTHLWIESCGQASCFIDEKNYILRDAKKEKEFGFSMPGSLACARQRPLLEGRRVLITPNTKPGKDVILSLIKAVKGQAVERIGRSMLKDDQIPDDLLVLSCEEDYDICLPFLQKGAAVYSSELLLNGIVTQKLEFERHRLFVDHVKRTRSTIWLKKDGNKFHPVAKHQ